jgi:hypothetical protein
MNNNSDTRTSKSCSYRELVYFQFNLSLSHTLAACKIVACSMRVTPTADLFVCLMPAGRPTKKSKAVPARLTSTRVVPVTNISSDHDGNTHITTHSHVVMLDPPLPEVPRYNPLNLEDSIQNEILDATSIRNTDTVSLRTPCNFASNAIL